MIQKQRPGTAPGYCIQRRRRFRAIRDLRPLLSPCPQRTRIQRSVDEKSSRFSPTASAGCGRPNRTKAQSNRRSRAGCGCPSSSATIREPRIRRFRVRDLRQRFRPCWEPEQSRRIPGNAMHRAIGTGTAIVPTPACAGWSTASARGRRDEPAAQHREIELGHAPAVGSRRRKVTDKLP